MPVEKLSARKEKSEVFNPWSRVDSALDITWDELADAIKGLGEITVKKLARKYGNPITLAFMPAYEITDVSTEILGRIRGYLYEKFLGSQFLTAKDLQRRNLPTLKLHAQLDDIVNLKPGDLTLFYGKPATGKTQICHHYAASIMLTLKNGGYAGVALYIDTENTFSLERVQEIYEHLLERYEGTYPETIIYKYTLRDPFDFERFVYFQLPELFKEAVKSKTPIRLVIIDSAIAPFREKFPGRGNLAARQQMLAKILGFLKDISLLFQIPVILTTQVVARPLGYGKDFAAAGGHTLLHNVSKIIELDFVKGDVRRATLVKGGPQRTVYYRITEKGVVSVPRSVKVE